MRPIVDIVILLVYGVVLLGAFIFVIVTICNHQWTLGVGLSIFFFWWWSKWGDLRDNIEPRDDHDPTKW